MNKLVYLLVLLPLFLGAQINESDTLKLKSNLSLTGFYQGGNVETLIFRAKSETSFRPLKNMVFKTTNSYVYQEFGKQKADEDILSLNLLYLNPDRNIYPLVLGFLSTNYRREIKHRSLVGAGVTFKIFDKKENWLKLSLSSEYEQTYFKKDTFNKPEYNGNTVLNTLRSTLWINGKNELFKKKLQATYEFYIQPSLKDASNFRWESDLGLELPLAKFLNFKINYLHTFEGIVIKNQKQEDSMISLGFKIKTHS